jgi:hypothetical protein
MEPKEGLFHSRSMVRWPLGGSSLYQQTSHAIPYRAHLGHGTRRACASRMDATINFTAYRTIRILFLEYHASSVLVLWIDHKELSASFFHLGFIAH